MSEYNAERLLAWGMEMAECEGPSSTLGRNLIDYAKAWQAEKITLILALVPPATTDKIPGDGSGIEEVKADLAHQRELVRVLVGMINDHRRLPDNDKYIQNVVAEAEARVAGKEAI